MARKTTLSAQDKQHLKNLLKQALTLRDIFGTATDKAVALGAATGFCDPNGEFLFDKFPAIKERVQELFRGLHGQLVSTISEGNRREWLLSAAKNDEMVKRLCERAGISTDRAKEWLRPNMEAFEAFQGRKERGMGLSDRVWRLTDQFKGELEMALELGLGDGKSAADLSRDVREYLNEPHKLFRRVRNEKGQLRLSKSAAAYHPGQGVYRSSYKNALRLTATENNMAYRTADHERWQQLDFVIGIEILLSNNHPCEDICDELAGVYPKTFKFVGWHPFCRCIAVPKLADEDEFIARQQALIDGQDVPEGGYSGEVTYMPDAFNNWVQNNAERIENVKNVPYFIRDNQELVQDAKNPSDPQAAALRQNDIDIEAALGVKRGKPMSFEEANEQKSNPNYALDESYRVNCQTCVMANELRRRGFDIEALANTKGSALEKLSYHTESAWFDAAGNTPTSNVSGLCKVKRKRWDGTEYEAWEKTCKNRKQMVAALESDITEDGRYHIKWTWARGNCGHIITVERIDGRLRYYDPQDGKVITDFVGYIDGIKTAGGIRWLRVDTLRANPDIAKKVLSKPKTGTKSGKAATGGVSGRVTPEVIRLRKNAIQSGDFPTSLTHHLHENLITTKLYLGNKPLNRILNHCVSADEIDAVKYIWHHPEMMHNPRVSPLGEGKDMSSERAQKNIANKRERGVKGYIEYEFEYAGKTWLVKTEEHRAGFEQFYHIRKK